MGWGVRALLLVTTVGLTALASFVLSTAVMTGQWESLTWRRDLVDQLTSMANMTDVELFATWFLEDRVSKIAVVSHTMNGDPLEIGRLYLVPMDSGIWTLCVALSDKDQEVANSLGIPKKECINYLNPSTGASKFEDSRSDWQQRMQNLSISCALVCLIILGSSALVGTFGILKHQISAILVTGVMYLLAGVFALFTLTMIHFKRHSSECPGPEADGIIVQFGRKRIVAHLTEMLSPARMITSGWGLELGWVAFGLCSVSAGLWLILARVMRFSPPTTIPS